MHMLATGLGGRMVPPRRPWLSAPAQARYDELAATVPDLDGAGRLARILEVVETQQAWVDDRCLNLNAATNLPNPQASRVLASTLGSRPSLGHPGDKYETGLGPSEELEVLAAELCREVFHAEFAEIRMLSGAMANLAVYMSCTAAGDRAMTLPPEAGGHATHHRNGTAGRYGLDVHPIPLRVERETASWQIDLAQLREDVRELRPALVVIGGSLALRPYPIAEVRAICDTVGATLLFDAAHLCLLIAGGALPDPLAEGAHVMTMSTYKSLGGPPGGLVVTSDAGIAAVLDGVAFPGLTANNDLGRVAALAVALNDCLAFGKQYAIAAVEAARALARALDREGLPVAGLPADFTSTHHVAVDARAWGGGTAAARLLEPANILATGIGLPLPPVPGDMPGLRLGVQELVRWGMAADDMPGVATLIADVLLRRRPAADVCRDVVELRKAFRTVSFVTALDDEQGPPGARGEPRGVH
jgi:glycine hydroxymethyltransferase